jgi:hypothetical protein
VKGILLKSNTIKYTGSEAFSNQHGYIGMRPDDPGRQRTVSATRGVALLSIGRWREPDTSDSSSINIKKASLPEKSSVEKKRFPPSSSIRYARYRMTHVINTL